MKDKVRVRFAPSPTGPLHMGGVRTALYNYLFAKRNNGDFVLRIEDTDRNRYVAEAEEYIINSLKWCGIEPNEGAGFNDGDYGPYRQSQRTELYQQFAGKLVENGNAYYAFDTPQELEEMRLEAEKNKAKFKYDSNVRLLMKNSLSLSKEETEIRLKEKNFVLRFKMPKDEPIVFQDIVRGEVIYNSSDLDDKIILKADGYPTYHLANVVDDYHMKISHVIRGEEWLPSTPLHVMLYKAFGWYDEMPVFAHLPLILKPSGKGKLSKRDGAKLGFPVFPLNWNDPETNELSPGYKEVGFLPGAFMNILALLGWHSKEEIEVFNLEQLVEEFSLERVVKSGARFDFEKAKWFNQQHLMQMSDSDLGILLQIVLKESNISVDDSYATNVCKLMKERVHFLSDIPEIASYFFGEVKEYDEKMVRKKFKSEKETFYQDLVTEINELSSFNAGSLEELVKSFVEKKESGLGAVLPIIRLCISGTVQGPSVFDIMELLGKETVVSRMRKALELFSQSVVN